MASEIENQFCFKGSRHWAVGSGDSKSRSLLPNPYCLQLIFAGLVAFGEAIRPDPIPNSAVKRLSANGTLSQDTGE